MPSCRRERHFGVVVHHFSRNCATGPAGALSIYVDVTNDLVDDARDRGGGVDYNAVFWDVFLRLVPSHDAVSLRWLAATPLVVRPLVKSPVQRVKVNFKHEDAVEQSYKF